MAKQRVLYDRLLPGQEVFGSFETADLLEVRRSMVNNDMKQGHLPTGKKVAWGRTLRTVFTRQEIFWIALFYQLSAIGLTKRHASAIVRRISDQPHDYILLRPSDPNGVGTDGLQFKNYLSVQVLDEINKAGATLVINYKKIRRDVDARIRQMTSVWR
jgi:hypothetical protein